MARLTREEFDAFVVQEQDAFRLAILGHTALEEEINAALDDAFEHGMLPEIKRLGFQARLALIVALGVIPSQHQSALAALATVRHKFAHGEIRDLSADTVRPLIDTLGQIAGDETRGIMRGVSPINALRHALIIARIIIDASIDAAGRRREEIARSVEEGQRIRALRNIISERAARAQPLDQ